MDKFYFLINEDTDILKIINSKIDENRGTKDKEILSSIRHFDIFVKREKENAELVLKNSQKLNEELQLGQRIILRDLALNDKTKKISYEKLMPRNSKVSVSVSLFV